MVDQAAEAKREGEEVNVRELVAAAREGRRPNRG